MKTNHKSFTTRASVTAVRGALIAMALTPVAYAADAVDPATTQLTTPSSSIEVGAEYVNHSSAKFGEYNGLDKKGGYAIGNVDLRGGGSYDSNDATRFRMTGTNLGLQTREVTAEYGQQGKFRINFDYDEQLRSRSDSYQTPYNGAGTNFLTLPTGWLVPQLPQLSATNANARGLSLPVSQSPALISGVLTAPTPAQTTAMTAIQAADLPAFHNVDLYTKRTKYEGGFGFNIDSQWDIKASVNHEHKDGYKPMGTVTRMNATTSAQDISTVIPDLINQDHDQYNLGVNFKSGQSFLSAAYYGSVFKNNVNSMSWQDWATGGAPGVGAPAGTILGTGLVNTMSSAPSNTLHQLNLTGGYAFNPTTRLVASGSYGRNTQNQAFVTDPTDVVVPASSLSGLVVTKDLSLKLTARPMSALNLTGAYKFNDRDNRTPVNTYQFADAQEAAVANGNFAAGTVLAQNANANRPYSKKLNQFNFDADYAFASGQALKAGWDWQKIDRNCNGSWIDCSDAATTKENTLRAEWRTAVIENVTTRLGYGYSQRRVSNYNENAFLALVPFANVVPTAAGAGGISAYQAMLLSGLTGYGPISGYNGGVFPGTGLTAAQAAFFFPNNNALANTAYANNNRISELPGMRRYYVADRNRDKLRASVNWQANEQLALQGSLDYNKDNFENSTYGLLNGKSWTLNLDGTYAVNQDLSTSLFYTYEDQRSLQAGNSYTANNNGAAGNASVNGFTAISGGCFATIALRNVSNKVDPCLNWSSDMRDKVNTLGWSFVQKNLVGGRLDVAGDVSFTRARSDNNAVGGNYVNNPLAVVGAPVGTVAAFFIPATALPTMSTDTLAVRLSGKYALDKVSAVRLGYTYSHMKAVDYSYDGMQPGGLAGILPSMETAPNFTVQVIGASYMYSFK